MLCNIQIELAAQLYVRLLLSTCRWLSAPKQVVVREVAANHCRAEGARGCNRTTGWAHTHVKKSFNCLNC